MTDLFNTYEKVMLGSLALLLLTIALMFLEQYIWEHREELFQKKQSQWLDRNWNLLFHRGRCIRIDIPEIKIKYNDLWSNGRNIFRSMGNGWFKIQENGNDRVDS